MVVIQELGGQVARETLEGDREPPIAPTKEDEDNDSTKSGRLVVEMSQPNPSNPVGIVQRYV